MRYKFLIFVLLSAAIMGGFSVARTQDNQAFMTTGGPTSQPIGHYGFCQRYPEVCSVVSLETEPLKLTPQTHHLLEQINSTVNNEIVAATDMEIYQVEEYWDYPVHAGDCEDYVLLKQKRLQQAGIPLSALLITVVRKPNGEGHAVLTVRTDEGDLILDNLDDNVQNWQETSYQYLKRQSHIFSSQWVSIESGRDLLVGALTP